jgi:hypothetical protein
LGVGGPIWGAGDEVAHAGEPFGAKNATAGGTVVFGLDGEFELLILIFNFHMHKFYRTPSAELVQGVKNFRFLVFDF